MTLNMDLWERISDALGGHDPEPADRELIISAYSANPDTVAKWPAEAKDALARVEGLQPQTWDDPADVPESIAP